MHYIITDIHNDNRRFTELLQKINLTEKDHLYLLGDLFCVRCLAAACACAGELKQRFLELAALYGILFEFCYNVCLLWKSCCIIEVFLLCFVCCKAFHSQCFHTLLARA